MDEYLRDDRNTRLKLNGRGRTQVRSFNGREGFFLQGGVEERRKRGERVKMGGEGRDEWEM